MASLDDLSLYSRLDPDRMLGCLRGFSEQCQQAWEKAELFPVSADYRHVNKVIVLGMGASAIGGDIVRSLVSVQKCTLLVQRDYVLPGPVDERTLIVALSYSGMTGETISAFRESLAAGCKKLAITTGGDVRSIAERARVPVIHIDFKSPPRAALAYCFLPLLSVLRRLNLVPSSEVRISSMVQVLEQQCARLNEERPESMNSAKQLARKLYKRLVVIYGGGFLEAVARRWKTQINENGKSLAFFEVFPESNHNAIEGYSFPREVVASATIVMLMSRLLDPRLRLGCEVAGEIIKRSHIRMEVLEGEGDDRLSQMMSLVYLGDWVSFYLAMLYGENPSPVKSIAYLKERLNTAGLYK